MRLAFIAIGLLLAPISSHAVEARCTELDGTGGATCFCSEPLQMTGFTQAGDDLVYNPNDSTTKQCAVEEVSVAKGAIVREKSAGGGCCETPLVGTDTDALEELPTGHSVARFVRAPDGHVHPFSVGNGGVAVPHPSEYVRIAARWYIYHSSNFAFKDENGCDNSKIAGFDFGSLIDYQNGAFHTYNYVGGDGWSPGIDCCNETVGPGPDFQQSPGQFKDKWWRFEVVIDKRSGSGYRMQMFGKNVTDDGQEKTFIDTDYAGSPIANAVPPAIVHTLTNYNHRFDNQGGSACTGWIGISHYMAAGWTTSGGQRIGAAAEIEGGGGGTSVIKAPFLLP